MKVAKLVFILSASLLFAGCSIGGKKSGIQVTANPQASVFLDNKPLGQTPVYQEGVKPGTYNIKITGQDSSLAVYEGKVTLNPGVLSVVDRQLTADPTKSFGYILSFEPLTNKTDTEVNLVSFPDTVSVMIDGAPVGFTPHKSNSVAAGGHTFTLTSPGYQDLVIKASIKPGHRLVVNAQLGAQTIVPTPTPIATPSASLTPTPMNEITPLPKQATDSAVLKPFVEILATPDNNHLKVRSENSIGNNILAIVNTGDKFPYFQTSGGWFQIEYQKGLKGWVSASYSKLTQ